MRSISKFADRDIVDVGRNDIGKIARAHRAVAGTSAASGVLPLNAIDRDDFGNVVDTVNNRMIIPSDGVYLVTALAFASPSSAAGQAAEIAVTLNGTAICYGNVEYCTAASQALSSLATDFCRFKKGDLLGWFWGGTAGITMPVSNVYNYMSICKIA